MKKKITIIGGAGTIGSVLCNGLRNKYEIAILDKKAPAHGDDFIEVDATNYEMLLNSIPKDSEALIHLLTVKTDNDLKEVEEFHKMTQVHFMATFYTFRAAIELGIPKVVFASSNHTTDYYENNGFSSLGREINTNDYPYSRGLYGVLKLASENIGHILAREEDNNLSIINLRIGSVQPDELKTVREEDRLHRTLLSHADTVQLFDLALQSTVKYGTYYGVSDNPGKPWSTETAWKELGFVSKENAMDVLKKGEE
ncbi:NAD-dependent epimerase/dehydratase family protein [Mesobacillus foraminis]|uniref:NAD-dependent epimerase/dehydratase family protein n=1 Tax=Mesobacillus foraminis TaxID=279826 RepID=A0A4R2B9J1_9BACI|nr:NAD(P)-dependent oxidoreductase [Mesobacillus foraminis]TCN22702.1 NAD-dependent epimerase/dehydratase family protein [Mesobacillus foraminis]